MNYGFLFPYVLFILAYENGLDVKFGFLFCLFVFEAVEIFGYVLVCYLSSF
jgi:hypothetical protein